MGYYTVDHNGSTEINEGSEDNPKPKVIRFKKDEPIDVKKGQLDHVSGAEYHKGKPKNHKADNSDEKE